jgi:lycopene beta-cyclase
MRGGYLEVVLDVLVVGGGPAGRAVAAACGRAGLRTTLVDRSPQRPWRATYAAWARELPADLPGSAIATSTPARAFARTDHDLGWRYTVLDTEGLRAHLDAELAAAAVGVRTARVRSLAADGAVGLDDGTVLTARLVIDAGGRWQPLANRDATRHTDRVPAEQTAVGVIVEQDLARPLLDPGTSLIMDWRADHGEAGWPTFLYAVPLGGGRVLLEETSLARRPGLGLPVLRGRLHKRLAAHGVAIPQHAPEERVHFPVDIRRHPDRAALGFGAAAPLMHPATGYSVATSLRLAPIVAAAAAGAPGTPLAAARSALWPRTARLTDVFRRRGLEALLRMPARQVPDFFEHFFAMPARHRWAYLTGRENLRGTTAAMLALFREADLALGLRLVGSVRHRVR